MVLQLGDRLDVGFSSAQTRGGAEQHALGCVGLCARTADGHARDKQRDGEEGGGDQMRWAHREPVAMGTHCGVRFHTLGS